ARIHRLKAQRAVDGPADNDGAGAAIALRAALLGPGEVRAGAKPVEYRHTRRRAILARWPSVQQEPQRGHCLPALTRTNLGMLEHLPCRLKHIASHAPPELAWRGGMPAINSILPPCAVKWRWRANSDPPSLGRQAHEIATAKAANDDRSRGSSACDRAGTTDVHANSGKAEGTLHVEVQGRVRAALPRFGQGLLQGRGSRRRSGRRVWRPDRAQAVGQRQREIRLWSRRLGGAGSK